MLKKKMLSFQEFDDYLQLNFSWDNWSDDASDYAHSMIQAMPLDVWVTLRATWLHRSQEWQERCAGVLSFGEPQYAVPALMDMVRFGKWPIRLAALDSLRETYFRDILQKEDLDYLASVIEQSIHLMTPLEVTTFQCFSREVT